ncbi:MAG: ferrous iron transport protein B [Oscillospiraceae bacterium]
MGLTNSSIGINALNSSLEIKKQNKTDKVIAIAGNPNVGKSTVFNGLTGLNQHTGNWPGKTVTCAQGYCKSEKQGYVMVDIPGTYSLMAHSTEEEVARNFICFGKPDGVVVVCDATCLERNLNLVLQAMEISPNVLVCVNLMDEAAAKSITLDLPRLSGKLGVPVVGTIARNKNGLTELLSALDLLTLPMGAQNPLRLPYPKPIERAIAIVEPTLEHITGGRVNARWLSLKLLDYDSSLISDLRAYLGYDILKNEEVLRVLALATKVLHDSGIDRALLRDSIVSCIVETAENICEDIVHYGTSLYAEKDRKIDKILTGKLTAYPIMLLLLAVVFWITIVGANYPSQLLSQVLFWFGDKISIFFSAIALPLWLNNLLVLGVYRVLAWVVAVMLPPMAIFFPLFTILEDVGYLPRIAYNLDNPFKKCHSCGKQALTMCMGFGCNAAGIVGCRIIDSPREKLVATITNSFVPCNGRFPTLIAIMSMFFMGTVGGLSGSFLSAILLSAVIVLGVFMTLAISKLLSKTILKGVPSSFTLELPSYRMPQLSKVIVRSIFDRTLFVLGRAVAVAAPAGLLIWVLANVTLGDVSLLACCSDFLQPFAHLLGMDGIILLAFILGFPANEIVFPIIIMGYLSSGSIMEFDNLSALKELLLANGWTWITAVSVLLFSLFHWPCSTTLLTIKKETGSLKWTALSLFIPTAVGFIICFVFAGAARLVQSLML